MDTNIKLRTTDTAQQIVSDFIESFPELKEFPALALEMQIVLLNSLVRYAKNVLHEEDTAEYSLKWNEYRMLVLSRISKGETPTL